MARKARIHGAGIVQHIMARCIEGVDLFADNEDRTTFLHLLEESLSISGHRCYAWAIMNNHYHLLLRSSEEPIGIMMRRLNSKYARYFSKKYNRRGYLFQGRYKSIATQEQCYIEEFVRYIHLNPVRSGICKGIDELDRYPWSGHSVIMGEKNVPFQEVKTVLERFGGSREQYRSFLKEGIEKESDREFIETIRRSNNGIENIRNAGSWVIGDSAFIRQVLSSEANRRIRVARYQKEGWDVSRLAKYISDKIGIESESIRKRTKNREIGDARKIFSYIGSKILEMPQSDIGSYLGISIAGVWASTRLGQKIMEKRGFDEFC